SLGRMAQAAASCELAQSRHVPLRPAAQQSDRHEYAGSATARARRAASTRRGKPHRAQLRRSRQRHVGARYGCGRSGVRPQHKPDYRPDLFDTPNPITVSETLLKREAFIPARSLNILAAAWIQFQVHDWVDHARYALGQNDVRVPLPQDFPRWRNTPDGPPEESMRIAGN